MEAFCVRFEGKPIKIPYDTNWCGTCWVYYELRRCQDALLPSQLLWHLVVQDSKLTTWVPWMVRGSTSKAVANGLNDGRCHDNEAIEYP